MAVLRMSPEEFIKELEKSVPYYIGSDDWHFLREPRECYDQATGTLSLDELGEFSIAEGRDYPCYCAVHYKVNSDLVITEVDFDEEEERAEWLVNYADDYEDPEREADRYVTDVWEYVDEYKDSVQEALNRIKTEWEVR